MNDLLKFKWLQDNVVSLSWKAQSSAAEKFVQTKACFIHFMSLVWAVV
jgi:hypothetical protein